MKLRGRHRGLRYGQIVSLTDANSTSLLVKGVVARKQIDADLIPKPIDGTSPTPTGGDPDPKPVGDDDETTTGGGGSTPPVSMKPKRYHGSVTLDAAQVGRDASKIAEEVIAHLVGLVGSKVTVTLEIEAQVPEGVPENVVRTVTENSRTLKFTDQGFEKE